MYFIYAAYTADLTHQRQWEYVGPTFKKRRKWKWNENTFESTVNVFCDQMMVNLSWHFESWNTKSAFIMTGMNFKLIFDNSLFHSHYTILIIMCDIILDYAIYRKGSKKKYSNIWMLYSYNHLPIYSLIPRLLLSS